MKYTPVFPTSSFVSKVRLTIISMRRETIGHVEHGKYNLSLLLAHKIAQTLESSIEEVFILEEEN